MDFDFFTNRSFSPSELEKEIPFLAKSKRKQASSDSLVSLVRTYSKVKVSFFGNLGFDFMKPHDICIEGHFPIASLQELAASKVKVIQDRAEAKDYVDLYHLLQHGVTLIDAVRSANHLYGVNFNPMLSIKALTWFKDGDLPSLDVNIQRFLAEKASVCDLMTLGGGRPMTLEELAQRVFWWKTSQEALADRHRFLAQVMTYGDVEDILTTKNHFTDDDFIEVLNRPPASVFDPRSWPYWHAVYKLPLSPLPTRFD